MVFIALIRKSGLQNTALPLYSNCQNYVPIDLANLSKVIASEAKQSIKVSKRLLRRKAPTRLSSSQARNGGLSIRIFDNRYNFSINKIRRCPVFVECNHY
jgi:hypothetical protein